MGRKKVWPPAPHPHRASGQMRVRVDGKDVYLGPIGSAEAARAYAALLTRWEAEGRGAAPEAPALAADLAVAELVRRFDDYATRRYAASEEAGGFRRATAALAKTFPGMPARLFGLPQLSAVREAMIARGWCRKTINRAVGRVRSVWRWAEENGLVPPGIWAGLRALRPLRKGDGRAPESPGRRACATGDFMRTVRACAADIGAILLLCWLTGARPSEMRRMRPRELDRSAEVWDFRPEKHKGEWREGCRFIPIGPRAQKVLRKWLDGKGPDDFVFARERTGKPVCQTSMGRHVKRAREKAGVAARVTSYVGRHCAKRRLTRSEGLDAARAVLGQASLTTTDRYDSGGDEAAARKAAAKLG